MDGWRVFQSTVDAVFLLRSEITLRRILGQFFQNKQLRELVNSY